MREDLSKSYLNNSTVFDIGKVPVKLVDLMLKSKREGNKYQWTLAEQRHHGLDFVTLHCAPKFIISQTDPFSKLV